MRWCVLLTAMLVSPHAAAGWLDWWRNADQQGKALLDAGEPAQAAQVFKDPSWRGAAQFEAGEFQQAAEAFAQDEGIEPLYNHATSLAHAGELRQSLNAFDELLKRQPGHEDGIANREWVMRQLEQQQDQQQDRDGGQSQDEQNNESQQADNEQTGEGSENKQEGGGSKLEDGRQMADNNNAEGQQGQQSAEESLKSALQELQEPDRPSGNEPDRQQGTNNTEQAASMVGDLPYSEATQALEQQLQRIPDDPAGLLRNKLYVTHQSRYSEIREGEEPW